MIGVFGANGFLGKNIVFHLRQQGLPVRAIARRFDDAAAFAAVGAETVIADLHDTDATARALEGCSHLVQLACTSSPAKGNREVIGDIEQSILPLLSCAEVCRSAGIERIVFASSGGTVYGPSTAHSIDEGHQTRPVSSYGASKLMTEVYQNLIALSTGLSSVVLRVSNPYGPHQVFRNGQGLIANVIAHCRAGTAVPVYGAGTSERDYVYVGDVSRAFHAALFAPDADGETINIGSGTGHSILQVLDEIGAALGTPVPRYFIEARSTDVPRNVLAIDHARAVLGWAPETPFGLGVANTLAFAGLIPDARRDQRPLKSV